MCCSVLQRVAVCCITDAVYCSVLQHVAACCITYLTNREFESNFGFSTTLCCSVLQYVAVRCCVLLCVAMCCRVLHSWRTPSKSILNPIFASSQYHTAARHFVLQYVAVCCGMLQCGAVCCSVLQCVARMAHLIEIEFKSEFRFHRLVDTKFSQFKGVSLHVRESLLLTTCIAHKEQVEGSLSQCKGISLYAREFLSM